MASLDNLCYVSDIDAATHVFKVPFTVRECDWLSRCSNHAQHVDPQSGLVVEAHYCATNPWTASIYLGVLLLLLALVVWVVRAFEIGLGAKKIGALGSTLGGGNEMNVPPAFAY